MLGGVSGGENIYPGDVERMLERHPAVAQACVVPIDDDIKARSRSRSSSRRQARNPPPKTSTLCARECARLSAPALRLFVYQLPLSTPTDRPGRAEAGSSEAVGAAALRCDEPEGAHGQKSIAGFRLAARFSF